MSCIGQCIPIIAICIKYIIIPQSVFVFSSGKIVSIFTFVILQVTTVMHVESQHGRGGKPFTPLPETKVLRQTNVGVQLISCFIFVTTTSQIGIRVTKVTIGRDTWYRTIRHH